MYFESSFQQLMEISEEKLMSIYQIDTELCPSIICISPSQINKLNQCHDELCNISKNGSEMIYSFASSGKIEPQDSIFYSQFAELIKSKPEKARSVMCKVYGILGKIISIGFMLKLCESDIRARYSYLNPKTKEVALKSLDKFIHKLPI